MSLSIDILHYEKDLLSENNCTLLFYLYFQKSILKKPNVGRVVLREEPSSYTLCAVLSCILCFPFGIYALTTSRQVRQLILFACNASTNVHYINFFFGCTLSQLRIERFNYS